VRANRFSRHAGEIPHAAAVEIESSTSLHDGAHRGTIHVEREGQKGHPHRSAGEKLKGIGTEAAEPASKSSWKPKCTLSLWVRVTPDWTNSDSSLAQLGYVDDP